MSDPIESAIDRLFHLVPGEFTKARNDLAKTAGGRAADVRRLQKPHPAAWAVNQLFWRDRQLFNQLASSSLQVRKAHVRRIGGRESDVSNAEARHAADLAAATKVARRFLEQIGTKIETTMPAVERTLQAVPAPEINGRLVRPLESVGFGLLSGLLDSAERARSTRRIADVTALDRGERRARPSAAQTRGAFEARKRERRRLDAAVRSAMKLEQKARLDFEEARRLVEKADRDVGRLEQALRRAREAADRRRDALERARAEANDAAASRMKAEQQRREFGD